MPTISSSVRLDFARISERYSTARTAIRTIGWCVAAFFFWKILESVAGRDTTFSAEISLLADVKFALALTGAGLAGLWGFLERRQRHRVTSQMQGRIKELETMLDPERSSSGLTTEGKTNPSDRRG